jgi:hypothetical protein
MTRAAAKSPQRLSPDRKAEAFLFLLRLAQAMGPAPAVREWLTATEAASLICRSPQAVRKRCRTHKIGVRVNGRWQINRAQLVSQK